MNTINISNQEFTYAPFMKNAVKKGETGHDYRFQTFFKASEKALLENIERCLLVEFNGELIIVSPQEAEQHHLEEVTLYRHMTGNIVSWKREEAHIDDMQGGLGELFQ
ncbi:hypothetical protein V3O24_04405 [Methylobacter sp. Wu8]|uniref:hypothetical protein n=1 Tax=Methylobacter sp. Wu8 TaxID=3118457 RepID=UPI002F312FFB